MLCFICTSIELHAVLTSVDGQSPRSNYLSGRGFDVLNVKREIVQTASSRRVVPNDFDISFMVGASLAQGGFNALLLGTGDGDLALAIARGVRRVSPQTRVYTLSVPGATSSRIQKEHAPELVAGNLFVDESLLRRPKSMVPRQKLDEPQTGGESCRVGAAAAGGMHSGAGCPCSAGCCGIAIQGRTGFRSQTSSATSGRLGSALLIEFLLVRA